MTFSPSLSCSESFACVQGGVTCWPANLARGESDGRAVRSKLRASTDTERAAAWVAAGRASVMVRGSERRRASIVLSCADFGASSSPLERHAYLKIDSSQDFFFDSHSGGRFSIMF